MLKWLLETATILSSGAMPAASDQSTPLMRAIPGTREHLPVVGLGTARAFDVGSYEEDRAPLREVLRLFVEHGGSLVNSLPLYGRAEGVVGDLAAELRVTGELFLATKVLT